MKLRTPREREVAERLMTGFENIADQMTELLEGRTTDPKYEDWKLAAHELRRCADQVRNWLADEPHEVTS